MGDPITQFNPATFMCLFQIRTFVLVVKCCGFFFMFNNFRWDVNIFFVQWCLWNCCLSLFRPSLHNIVAKTSWHINLVNISMVIYPDQFTVRTGRFICIFQHILTYMYISYITSIIYGNCYWSDVTY